MGGLAWRALALIAIGQAASGSAHAQRVLGRPDPAGTIVCRAGQDDAAGKIALRATYTPAAQGYRAKLYGSVEASARSGKTRHPGTRGFHEGRYERAIAGTPQAPLPAPSTVQLSVNVASTTTGLQLRLPVTMLFTIAGVQVGEAPVAVTANVGGSRTDSPIPLSFLRAPAPAAIDTSREPFSVRVIDGDRKTVAEAQFAPVPDLRAWLALRPLANPLAGDAGTALKPLPSGCRMPNADTGSPLGGY